MEKPSNNWLMLPSGCITIEAFEALQADELSANEKIIVEHHLDQCNFCREAYEGFVSTADFKIHKEALKRIQSSLNSSLNLKKKSGNRLQGPGKRKYYYAAAASILILFGFFSIYTLLFNDPRSVVAEDSSDLPKFADSVISEPIQDLNESLKSAPSLNTNPDAVKSSQKTLTPALSDPVISTATERKQLDDLDEIDSSSEYFIATDEAEIHIDSSYNLTKTEVLEHVVPVATKEENVGESPIGAISGVRAKKTLPAASMEDELDMEQLIHPARFFTPEYKDFDDYVQNKLVYPEIAKEEGVEGLVIIVFEVARSGKLRNIKIIESPHPLLEKEALRLVKASPDWIPAQEGGTPVATKTSVRIQFKIK